MESYEKEIPNLSVKEQAIKISINSLYGAYGNKKFRYFRPSVAESITMTGQLALKTIEMHVDRILNEKFKTGDAKYLIYQDTDSCYFTMDAVVKRYLGGKPTDEIVRALETTMEKIVKPEINILMDQICKRMNAKENRIFFKLEAVGDKALFIGKKRYIVRVHSSEGVTFAEPYYKVMGLDLAKSSTPMVIRSTLKDCIPHIFDGTENDVQDLVQRTRVKYDSMTINQIAFPRSVNNLEKYSDSGSTFMPGTPIHVRGALVYNKKLSEMGLAGRYPLIAEGSKIRFSYMKLPNKLRSNVVAWPADNALPGEFGVDAQVDYETQWEKTMLSSLNTMLAPVGWTAEAKSSLEDFFS